MNGKSNKTTLTILIFISITIFIFRAYFFFGKIPFPANLLSSFYVPWSLEQIKGWEYGIANKPLGHDNIKFFYPLKTLYIEALRHKELPLWNPYIFSGNVFLADSQSAFFYPLNIIYFLLPQIEAWTVIIIVTPVLSAWFMYLFLKELKCSHVAAFFGSLTWAFSGFFAVWMEENNAVVHSSLWLPLMLFCILKWFNTRKIYYCYILLVSLCLSVLAGHLQFAIYSWITATGYTVYLGYFRYKIMPSKIVNKLTLLIIVTFIMAFLVSAIQIIPVIEAQSYTSRNFARSTYLFDIYLKPIVHIVSLIAPDWKGNPGTYNYFGDGSYYDQIIFIGIIPLFFALFAFFSNFKDYEKRFFIICSLIALLMGFKNPLSETFYRLDIPFFSSMIPSRIFFLFMFSASILSALGFEEIWKNNDKKILRCWSLKSILIIVLILLVGWSYYFFWKLQKVSSIEELKYQTTMFRNLLLPTMFTLFLAIFITIFSVWFNGRKKFLVVLILIMFGQQYYYLQKSLYFSERIFLYPPHQIFTFLKEHTTIERFWSIGKAEIAPNVASNFKLLSPEGLDPVYLKWYGELIEAASSDQKREANLSLIEVRLPSLHKDDSLVQKPRLLRLLSLLGIKYLVGHKSDRIEIPKDQFDTTWDNGKWIIYENKKAIPRFLATTDYIIERNKQAIFKLLFDQSLDLNKTVILEEEPSIPITRDSHRKTDIIVSLVNYLFNSVTFQVQSSENHLFFLSDVFCPGWKAFIDNQETTIIKANYAFRAIAVPNGSHRITFVYRPQSFTIGFFISVISSILLLPLFFVINKYV